MALGLIAVAVAVTGLIMLSQGLIYKGEIAVTDSIITKMIETGLMVTVMAGPIGKVVMAVLGSTIKFVRR